MSCCNFENTKQNAQNYELHQNENKCADRKYITYHVCAHLDHIYTSMNTSSCPANIHVPGMHALSCLLKSMLIQEKKCSW